MIKYLYNNSGVEKTYVGVPIPAGTYFQIPPLMVGKYADCIPLQQDVLSGAAQLSRDGTSVISDPAQGINFLKSLDPTDSEGYPKIRPRAFNDTDGYFFRGKGVAGTATAGQVTNINYKVTHERWINGAHVLVRNQTWGDSIQFNVVDVDNILGYGAGVVLNTFADTWKVATDKQDQGVFKIEYPARVLAGLYIQLRYTSIGATDVDLACNLFLHEKT